MRKPKEHVDTPDDIEEVGLSAKEQKKLKIKEGAQKRMNARKRDKVARWGGLILLGLMMFIGFLLWVAGEMRGETARMNEYRNAQTETNIGTVIVK